MSAVCETIEEKVPKTKTSLYMKRWWNEELVDRCREEQRVAQHAYRRRAHPHDLVHKILKAKRSTYASMVEHAKRVHWEEFLSSLDEKNGMDCTQICAR